METTVGLNPIDQSDAILDLDSDQWSNIDEYQLGTGISDSSDFPLAHVNPLQIHQSEDPIFGERLGSVVDIDGDFAIASASGGSLKAVYILSLVDGKWREQQRLVPSGLGAISTFGQSVAISGDTAAITVRPFNTNRNIVVVYRLQNGIWMQETTISSSDSANFDNFGQRLAIDGDTLVVSAPGDDDKGNDSGSLYVFTRDPSGWSEQTKLTASDGGSSDALGGSALSFSGDVILASAPFKDGAFSNAGAVYVFKRTGTAWTEIAKLESPTPALDERFGSAAAISDDYAIIGALGNNSYAGGAYIFEKVAGDWSFQVKLSPSDLLSDDRAGVDVDLDGDFAVIGTLAGKAYYYNRSAGSWSFLRKVALSSNEDPAGFGATNAISADTIIFGASTKLNLTLGGNGKYGAVYFNDLGVDEDIDDDGFINIVDTDIDGDHIPNAIEDNAGLNRYQQTDALLDLDSDGWSNVDEYWLGFGIDNALSTPDSEINLPKKLFEPRETAADNFGRSITIQLNEAILGVPNAEHGGVITGAAYLYEFVDGIWQFRFKFVADDAAAGDAFGYSVAMHSDRVIIGAPLADGSFVDEGAVYVFRKNGNTWDLLSKVVSTDPSARAGFGTSVGMSVPVIIVGAPYDDELGEDAGAAYVYEQTANSFVFQEKLLGFDTEAEDHFGFSVAIRQQLQVAYKVAVGAPQDDDDGTDSGSVFLYFGGTPSITPQGKLTLPDAATDKRFGERLAIMGETLAVGVPGDDEAGTDAGAVYMYRSNFVDTTFEGKLLPDDLQSGDRFGEGLAVTFDRTLVGAPNQDSQVEVDTGSIYLFHRVFLDNEFSWPFIKKVTPPDLLGDDNFGSVVGIHPDHIIALAPGADDIDVDAGIGYSYTLDLDEDGIQDLIDPDIDGDGVPNDFERNEKFAPDALYDFDLDGWTNLEEFLALSNPQDELSTPIDSVNPAHRLFASDANQGSRFGWAVDIDGDTAMVVAPCAPASSVNCPGTVYVYQRNGMQWTEVQRLLPPVIDYPGGGFHPIALSGDVFVLGIPGATLGGDVVGSALIYENLAGVWKLTSEIWPSNPSHNGGFGRVVATDGTTVAIGSQDAQFTNLDDGAVYIFERDASGWNETQQIQASDAQYNDRFGYSIAIAGNNLAVGAYQSDTLLDFTGAVYTYEKTGQSWGNEIKLTPSALELGDNFGFAVAMHEERLVVGAPRIGNDKGGIFIFEKNVNDVWEEIPIAQPSDVVDHENYGNVLDIDEEYLVVGASQSCCSSLTQRVYVFHNDGDTFPEHTILFSPESSTFNGYPRSVAVSGDVIIVGEDKNDALGLDAGMAYLFDLDIDADLLFNTVEFELQTNPFSVDTDNDYINDYDEVNRDDDPDSYQVGVDTDPTNADTDGDGVIDGLDPDPLNPAISRVIPVLPWWGYCTIALMILVLTRRQKFNSI